MEEKKMKFGISGYWKPTPKIVRKVADSLSAAALAASAFSFTADHKIAAYVILACSFVGKFLSNLFSED